MASRKVMVMIGMMSTAWYALGAECSASADCEEDDIGLIQLDKVATKQASKIIGKTTGMIDGSKDSCREHECAYGILLTDELLRYGKTVNSETRIALYNGGGIRASIPKGDITEEHLKAVHPYGNTIFLAEVPGSAIQQMVEVALKEHGAPLKGAEGNWLQRSGMRFTSSWQQTSSSWSTPEIEVAKGDGAWEPLDLDHQYDIVTNKYVMDGNGGRDVIKSAAKEVHDTQKTVISLMTEYFKANSPVSPPSVTMHY